MARHAEADGKGRLAEIDRSVPDGRSLKAEVRQEVAPHGLLELPGQEQGERRRDEAGLSCHKKNEAKDSRERDADDARDGEARPGQP